MAILGLVAFLFVGAKCQTLHQTSDRFGELTNLAGESADIEAKFAAAKAQLQQIKELEDKIRDLEQTAKLLGGSAAVGLGDSQDAAAAARATAQAALLKLQLAGYPSKAALKKEMAELKARNKEIKSRVKDLSREHAQDVAASTARDAQRDLARGGVPKPDKPKPKPEPKIEKPKPEHHHCFVAGTLVHTPEGPRSIEHLKVGDRLTSYDESTRRVESARVMRAHESRRMDLVEIRSANGTIVCSFNHRFHTRQEGWRTADSLAPEDHLLGLDETGAQLKAVRVATKPAPSILPVPVYNLAVERNHTYFVGEDAVLCHNTK